MQSPCPTCKRPVEWSDQSPWRPFCSERCKLIDLGAWAAGQRTIPGDPIGKEDADAEEEAHENKPSGPKG